MASPGPDKPMVAGDYEAMIAADRAAFEDAWPFVVDITSLADIRQGLGDLKDQMRIPMVLVEFFRVGLAAIDGLEPWLIENCGEKGVGWEFGTVGHWMIGIRDPDAAFWFKMRWM